MRIISRILVSNRTNRKQTKETEKTKTFEERNPQIKRIEWKESRARRRNLEEIIFVIETGNLETFRPHFPHF
jgi:hypothetical protein